MTKHYKKIRIILSMLFLSCTAGLAGIGNYFVNYALIPADARGDEVEPEADPSMQQDDRDEIEKNRKIITKQKEDWLSSAEKETTSLVSADGFRLEADKFYPKTKTHKWALLVHGYGSRREKMQNIGSFYALNDFNLLLPDLRAQGGSEGNFIGMGWLEKNDLLLWIDHILKEDPDAEIILHGVSMGAATVMMTSGETLPEQVKAVVEDCGYTSAWDIFADELQYLFELPPFPVLYASSAISRIRAGFSLKEASALSQIAKCRLPVLFIHGDKDTFVKPDMVYDLYEAASTEKELLIVPGAGHNESYLRDPDTYFDTVFTFIDKYLS